MSSTSLPNCWPLANRACAWAAASSGNVRSITGCSLPSLASVTSSPANGSTFTIGDTIVSSTAVDAAGNQAVCAFTVHVSGAAEQINNLIALVQSMGLPSGAANSLIVKLEGAAGALDRANLEAARGNFGALLNEVNAQTGKKLTPAQAELLIAEARRIRVVLGGN